MLAGLCLCALLAAGVTVPAKAAGFRDVPAGHWASAAIDRCVAQGWFQGKSADIFGVGQPMTRGAFAVVLSRFFGWQSGGTYYQIFSDVPQGAWYEPALRACYEHGAVTRQTDTFRPGDAITREELAVMLIRALGYGPIAGLAEGDAMPFQDVTTNKGHIAMAYELGLVSGVGQNRFAPTRAASREQAAVMLSRLYEKLHQTVTETMALVHSGEEQPDFTGVQTAIFTAANVTGGKNPRLNLTAEGNLSEQVSAARKAGCAVLLGITVAGTAADPAATASLAAQAVADGKYDGVYLAAGQMDAKTLTALAAALRTAMPDKRVYAAAAAPQRGGDIPDYTALGKAVDRLVLQVPAYENTAGAVPVLAMEPVETVYYALGVLNNQVPAEKLTLYLTAGGHQRKTKGGVTSLTGAEVERLAEKGTVYYSDRYACAYLQSGDATVWYLNDKALTAREQLTACFGVRSVCLSTLWGTVSPAKS